MDSRAPTFDDYRKQLQMVLEDPNDEAPVAVPLDYLKAITDGFSSDRLIGRGGFGEVYRGDLGSEKSIAIKKLVYGGHLVDDHKYKAELDSVIRIRHQNIVLLIGYCAETKMELVLKDGEHVLAEKRERLLCFEYISNGSLGDLIPELQIFKNEDVLGWEKRYTIMEGICSGLAFLHEECNLTHMDLKPENILMDSNMVPKITDFGLSRPRDPEQSTIFTQTLTGTLGYMPPEFLVEGKISLKTDIYSLGVIMCQIITGEKVQLSMELLIQRACGRWMKIFEKSLSDASLKEKYIKQVKQMIDIALKCMEHDRTKRPSSSDILQIFNINPVERSKCEQVIELLSVHPLQLDFSLPDPKQLNCSSCSLQLTNNMDIPVAFRLLPSETLAAHFSPQSGVVPPKCRYTLAVMTPARRNSTFGNDGFFTLESTKARVGQGLRFVDNPSDIFMTARERGFKVHEVKLAFACAHTELPIGSNLKPELAPRVSWDGQDINPGLMIIPLKKNQNRKYQEICVHPTQPWIFIRTHPCSDKFFVWDYHRQEKVHFHLTKKQRRLNMMILREDDDVSYGDADGLRLPGPPKFIPQKRWILVGSTNCLSCRSEDNCGYINVYSYMAVQNFKGSKTYLVSKIKSFKAHENEEGCCNVLVDVHPSRPYVLSSVASKCLGVKSETYAPMDSIKLWDWENGWNCVMTFNMEFVPKHFKFSPKDQDTFVTISSKDFVKVWNIDSPECKSTLPGTEDKASYFDFFDQGGKQYLIIVHKYGNKCTIWDYHSGTLVQTLKENKVCTACSHPELPVLITCCRDGRVALWSSSTFSLVGVLNCGLGEGEVHGVAGVKGSGRIVINHEYGIAVAEIGHMLESERPHEQEESEIEESEIGDR